MTDEKITKEELEEQNGEELPDREAMSILPIETTGVPVPLDDLGDTEPDEWEGKAPRTL